MQLISSLYHRSPSLKYVRVRRINRETLRVKLAKACFINVPRLIKVSK